MLLFASYREAAGRSSMDIDLPDGSTVRNLALSVTKLYPAIPCAPERIVAAVNGEYSRQDKVLGDGDEVALIPPVSGGAP